MIRINLLPIRAQIQKQNVKQQFTLFLIVIVIMIIACYFWILSVSEQKQEMQKSIAKAKTDIQKIDIKIKEINNFKKDKEEFEKKLDIITNLKKGKTGPVRMFADLAENIPDRVWLEKFEEKEGAVTLDGFAVRHEDVSFLMVALEKSKYFDNIVLIFTEFVDVKYKKGKSLASAKISKFRITCRVSYTV